MTGCATPGKAILIIKDKNPTGASAGDKLLWKWLKGPALVQADFGDPVAGSNGFGMCVYDTGGLVTSLHAAGGGTCEGKPCWKVMSNKGYKYRDRLTLSDGFLKIVMKGGDAGKSKIIVKAKGSNLPLPVLPLDDSSGVTVQLFRDDAGTPCWQTDFATSIKNDSTKYKGKTL